jgi:hypothetical protein
VIFVPKNVSWRGRPGRRLAGGIITVNTERYCFKCGEETLRTWDELGDDERELVQRLPGSAAYSAEERKAMHRWCTRCWHEENQDQPRVV